MKLDLKSIAQLVGKSVVEIVTPILERLKALEARVPERGEKGERGEQGSVGEKGEQGIQGERGERGETGASGVDGQHGPEGAQGEKGDRGESGPAGEIGIKGDTGDRGEPGLLGPRGEPGPVGERGATGDVGPAGRSLTIEDVRDFLEAGQAKWQLEAERVFRKRMDDFIAALPLPKDGADGLPIDAVEFDQERRALVFLRDGKEVRSLKLYTPRHEGVWRDGEYEKGLWVTFGGNVWKAVEDTKSKPGTDASWMLIVKKGRDGRDMK